MAAAATTFRCLLALAAVLVLAACHLQAAVSAAAKGTRYTVGGADGWRVPPPEDKERFYADWAANITFYVDDFLGTVTAAAAVSHASDNSHACGLPHPAHACTLITLGSTVLCRVRVQERLGDQGGQGGVLPLHQDRPLRGAAGRHRALRPRRPRPGLLHQPRPRPLQHGAAAHGRRPRRPRGAPVVRAAVLRRADPRCSRRRPGARRLGAGGRFLLSNCSRVSCQLQSISVVAFHVEC